MRRLAYIDSLVDRLTLLLCGLQSLHRELADLLATHHGMPILNGVRCLDTQVVAAFARDEGPLLALDGSVHWVKKTRRPCVRSLVWLAWRR